MYVYQIDVKYARRDTYTKKLLHSYNFSRRVNFNRRYFCTKKLLQGLKNVLIYYVLLLTLIFLKNLLSLLDPNLYPSSVIFLHLNFFLLCCLFFFVVVFVAIEFYNFLINFTTIIIYDRYLRLVTFFLVDCLFCLFICYFLEFFNESFYEYFFIITMTVTH